MNSVGIKNRYVCFHVFVIQQAKLLRLFADSGVAKLGFVTEYLEDLMESCPKFLVFAHHQVSVSEY
jgi:hypothetical protein